MNVRFTRRVTKVDGLPTTIWSDRRSRGAD
jgi:hypothetical protein